MEQYLWLYCSYWQDDWTEWLLMAEFAYNNQIHLATGKSPFFINLGHHPNTGREVERLEGNTPSVDAFLEVIERTKREVKMALEKTNKVMERKFNVRKKTEIDFQKGDLVWVDGSHYNDGRPLKKLSFKRVGPFPIIQKVGDMAYELKIPSTWRNIHPVINRSALKPYLRPTFEQQAEKSNIILTPSSGQERIQEVEKILDSRWRGEQLQYLVKWRGQPLEEITWEDCYNVIQEAPQAC